MLVSVFYLECNIDPMDKELRRNLFCIAFFLVFSYLGYSIGATAGAVIGAILSLAIIKWLVLPLFKD